MIDFIRRHNASRRERLQLAENRQRLELRQAKLECQLIEASTRMAMEQANPIMGDSTFRAGIKSMLLSEPDFPERAKLLEGIDYFDTLVDPYDAVRGENGELWDQIASAMYGASEPFLGLLGFRNELELRMARNLSRLLCKENPWAINILENRISYTIGSGHTYQVVAKDGEEIDPKIIAAVQAYLDNWCKANRWPSMQADNRRRVDMDGECFLRFFDTATGLQVRYVEPWQVATPAEHLDPAHAWGIEVDINDAQTIKAYWIDSQQVSADDVQHRKLESVLRNVRRGIPLVYPIRFHLRRAEQLLKNMGLMAQIRASIGLIRKWPSGTTGTQMSAFKQSVASATYNDAITGENRTFQRFRPGGILDVKAGYEYEFPGAEIDASSFVECLQAELRAAASRVNMPEFMVTSDASNANYSSTMVAEGPAVKVFERLQGATELDDLDILWRALRLAAKKMNAPFPLEILDALDIIVGCPNIIARNRLQETQARQIQAGAGILSPQKWSSLEDLDYQQEQANIQDHFDRFGGRPVGPGGEFADGGQAPSGDDLAPLAARTNIPTSIGGEGGLSRPLGNGPPMQTGGNPPQPNNGKPVERPDDLAYTSLNAVSHYVPEPWPGADPLTEGGPGSGPHPGEASQHALAMSQAAGAKGATMKYATGAASYAKGETPGIGANGGTENMNHEMAARGHALAARAHIAAASKTSGPAGEAHLAAADAHLAAHESHMAAVTH